MSAALVADFAIRLVQNLPQLISAGMDVVAHINDGVSMLNSMKLEDRGPTTAEYEALRQMNERLHDQFQAIGGSAPGASGPDA